MTGCESHGDLLGGYVLGALEPDEQETMRRHLESCELCAREHASLAGLPLLLDHVDPADVPPPQPPPELEHAILDRWARERRPSGWTRRPAHGRARDLLRRWWRPAAVVAAGLAAVLVALAIALPGGGDDTYAHGTLRSVASDGTAWGSFTVDDVSAGTRIKLDAERLPAGGNAGYELWCVRTDGRWVSGGSFRPEPDGHASATLTAAVEPGDYHEMVVTRQGFEGARGPEMLRGELVY